MNPIKGRVIGGNKSKNGGQRGNLLLRERRGQLNGKPDFERAVFGVAQPGKHLGFIHGTRDGARLAVELIAATVQVHQVKREPAQRVF